MSYFPSRAQQTHGREKTEASTPGIITLSVSPATAAKQFMALVGPQIHQDRTSFICHSSAKDPSQEKETLGDLKHE